MRQRLAIARAIIHNPDLLMLDEPTMGLDPATADRVRRFILDQRKLGRTILICTHYMDEVEQLCDRIGIMDRGSLIVSGGIEEIKSGCNRDSDKIEVVLRSPVLGREQLSLFESYELTPSGIVGHADLNSVYEALRPNGIISIRRLRPSLKESFVLLTEGVGDSN
jgi:ABC-2 type transport system ATP-binding protein